MEALKERGLLRQNAPHLVHDLGFIVPSYAWWQSPFYGLGLKVYNLLAGKYGFGRSHRLSREETLQLLPTIKTDGLRGGVIYYDGQFDDTRLLIHLVLTAVERGATVANYVQVTGLSRDGDGLVDGVLARDLETGQDLHATAKVVINATGAFADRIRRLVDPAAARMIAPSQGVHLVFERSFLPGNHAIMVPHTRDGRVMFAIPWHDHTLVGTTDTPVDDVTFDPVPLDEEIDFILSTAADYLTRPPARADVLSTFAGIRPLVRAADGKNTAALSRDHTIHIDESGLLTIAGGKWTTYRNMAEDCVNQAATLAQLPDRPCETRTLRIHGYDPDSERFGSLAMYGSDAARIQQLMHAEPRLAEPLHPKLQYCAAEVVWAARQEMARTVDDVLARRIRALFLNARVAVEMAPRVAELLVAELSLPTSWAADQLTAFKEIATRYMIA
jgi:glycerol-3-phosphate dehydrogenase